MRGDTEENNRLGVLLGSLLFLSMLGLVIGNIVKGLLK